MTATSPAGPLRRITFMVVTLVTAPVWLAASTAVCLAWAGADLLHWIRTGESDYVPQWVDRFGFMIERRVRAWLTGS